MLSKTILFIFNLRWFVVFIFCCYKLSLGLKMKALSKFQVSVLCYDMVPSLPHVHIHLLFSDRERHLWSRKYIKFLCLSFTRRSLHFLVRVFSFFSYLLCYNMIIIISLLIYYYCYIKFNYDIAQRLSFYGVKGLFIICIADISYYCMPHLF